MSNEEQVDVLSNTYNADSIGGALGMEAIRLRTSKYISSTGIEGILSVLWEIIENSIDEEKEVYRLLKESGQNPQPLHINITINRDGSVYVADQGRGLPVGINKKFNLNSLYMIFEYDTLGGKNYVQGDDNAYKSGRQAGVHGSGACIAAATSEFFSVRTTSVTTKHTHTVAYAHGKRVQDIEDMGTLGISNGCEIYYKYDSEIFKTIDNRGQMLDFPYPLDRLEDRLREYALFNDNLIFNLSYQNNVMDMPVTKIFDCKDFSPSEIVKSWTQNTLDINLDDSGDKYTFTTTLGYGVYKRVIGVNGLALDRSIHEDVFRECLEKALYKRTVKLVDIHPKVKFGVNIDNLPVGYISLLNVQKPEFTGQKKSIYSDAEIGMLLNHQLTMYFSENIPFLDEVCTDLAKDYAQRVEEFKKSQEGKQRKKLIKEMTNKELEYSQLVYPKETDLTKCNLVIVEGKTGGTLCDKVKNERTCVLPLDGLIDNIVGIDMNRFMNSERFKTLYKALNNPWRMVYIFTDADSAGDFIQMLLISLLYEFFRDKLMRGQVAIIQTPLYKEEVRLPNVKKPQVVYFYTKEDYRKFASTNTLTINGISIPVTERLSSEYVKGIGALASKDISELLNNDENHLLIDPNTVEQAMSYFKTYFGNNTKLRNATVVQMYATENYKQYADMELDRIDIFNDEFDIVEED